MHSRYTAFAVCILLTVIGAALPASARLSLREYARAR